MKIRRLLGFASIAFSSVLNAQWDTLQTSTDVKLNCIAFANPTEGVACGLDPATDSGSYARIFVTANRGGTWFPLPFFEPFDKGREIHSAAFTPDGQLLTARDSGTLVLQTIWFVTYTSVAEVSPYALLACHVVNDSTFFAAGENGIAYRTSNRGLHWDTLTTGTTTSINDIAFTDAANGWLVADGGYVATTSDSGNTWTFVQQPLWGFYDYNSFAYQGTSGTNPYVVGETGKALASLDGGNSWYGIATGTTNNLNCVRFGTTNAGLMCGDNGFIYRTDNAAWTWTAENSPSNANLYDIAFADDSTAFICGDSGVVLRSTINISSVEESSSAAISASAFPNPFNGTLFVDVALNTSSPVEIRINDIAGKQIRVNATGNATAGLNRIEVSGTEELAAGMYFITITSADAMITLPVVRQ